MNARAKYAARARAVGSLLCVGLDTDASAVPEPFRSAELPQFAFNRWLIDQTHPCAAAYKINTAFYEARGAQGWAALEATIGYLRAAHPAILTICDAKRGDIGSTSGAYAEAVFDHLGFDCITLNPYLGQDALLPFLERADKGCILLCRTSNAGSGEFQALLVEGEPLWLRVARGVAERWDARGNCMLVVGATYPREIAAVRAIAPALPLLIPGIGAQGGDLEATVRAGADAEGGGVILSISRSIAGAGDPGAAAAAFRDAIRAAVEKRL